MGIQEAFIQKLFNDAIKQLKPAEVAKEVGKRLVDFLKSEIALLKGDADGDGVIDGVEIERDLRVILEASARIAKVLEVAHAKKGK